MRRITKMFKSLLLLSLVLLMTNCATEEIGQKNVAKSSSEAKIWFDSHQKDYNATVLNYIGSLQWQNAIISEGEDGEIIEVPFNLSSNLSATTKEADQYNDHHRLMFIKDEQNGFKLFYIQILTNDENYKIQDKNYNYYNIKDTFNGKIFVQELATNAGTKIEFKKGKKLEPSLTAKYSENEIQCVYYGYWYEDGHFEPLYEVGCYASGGSDPQYLPAPDYGGGSSTNPNPSESCPAGYVYKLGDCFLDQKIFDQLTGKAKCIYLRLMASSLFSNAIKKFDGDFSVSHLKLTINNNLEPYVFAITKLPVNYTTEIQYDNTKLGILSDLGSATVFAHEIIHAEMFRKMLSAAQNGSLEPTTMSAQQQTAYVNSLKNNYPGLMDYFFNRNHPTWNHDMMATHYRGIIADIIQQFDNNRLPRSTYESVAWFGLGNLGDGKTTVAWANLSSAQKTAISNLISENIYKGPSNCN